jgi:hypothetical protein
MVTAIVLEQGIEFTTAKNKADYYGRTLLSKTLVWNTSFERLFGSGHNGLFPCRIRPEREARANGYLRHGAGSPNRGHGSWPCFDQTMRRYISVMHVIPRSSWIKSKYYIMDKRV